MSPSYRARSATTRDSNECHSRHATNEDSSARIGLRRRNVAELLQESRLKYRTKCYTLLVKVRVRVFKSRRFRKFARNERITDELLCQSVADAERGRIDADYGGGVIKQRISRPNEGKSGGYRSIILFRRGERAFFVYGFAKKDQANISPSDERDFKELARLLFAAPDEQLKRLIERKEFVEVACHGQG